MTIPPQVIKRGENYAVTNVDTDPMTKMQRLALAVEIWDQVRTLMEVNGEYKAPDKDMVTVSTGFGSYDDIDNVAGDITGTARSQVRRLRSRLMKRPDVLEKMRNNEYASVHDVERAVGLKIRSKLEEGRASAAKFNSSYYGMGDKFVEVMEPLERYLHAWGNKGFAFPHVPPREAQRRVARIDKAMGDLACVREDLMQRSHLATLRAPSEKRKGDK